MHHGHHHSPHPEDARLFAPERLPDLRRAVEEVCWMLGQGYPMSLAVETEGAIDLLGAALARWSVARCVLWVDAPVSNSGRLRALIEERSARWEVAASVEMVLDADTALRGRGLVASADAIVIDGSPRWCNLARAIVEGDVPTAWRVDLSLSP